MIESCTKRRMLVVILLLVVLSLIALGLESFLTTDDVPSATVISPNSTKEMCWLTKEFRIVKECQTCSQFDLNLKHAVCLATGYKELIRCVNEEHDAWRSCDKLPWMEKRNFWIFQSSTFVLGLFSGLITFTRQRQLNRRTLDRIQKQISAGV